MTCRILSCCVQVSGLFPGADRCLGQYVLSSHWKIACKLISHFKHPPIMHSAVYCNLSYYIFWFIEVGGEINSVFLFNGKFWTFLQRTWNYFRMTWYYLFILRNRFKLYKYSYFRQHWLGVHIVIFFIYLISNYQTKFNIPVLWKFGATTTIFLTLGMLVSLLVSIRNL